MGHGFFRQLTNRLRVYPIQDIVLIWFFVWAKSKTPGSASAVGDQSPDQLARTQLLLLSQLGEG